MAMFKVPLDGAVYVEAENPEEAREKVRHWFKAFPPIDEKAGIFTHEIAARAPERTDPERLPNLPNPANRC